MPVVKVIDRVDDFDEDMAGIGYEPRGEFGITGRRYFPKGGDNRTHHVHIFELGSPQIERHVAFRDYLRMHPDEAEKYGDLEEKLAKQFPYYPSSYVKGKELLGLEMERKVLEWHRSGR